MSELNLQEMTHGALQQEVQKLFRSGEALNQMLEFEERRRKAAQRGLEEVSANLRKLAQRLSEIKSHWQAGVAELDTPWRKRMEELLDWEGLIEG